MAADEIAPAFPHGHYYSPYPSADDLRRWHGTIFDRTQVPADIDLCIDEQVQLVRALAPMAPDAPFGDEHIEGLHYQYRNNMYSYGDGLTLYLMLRHLRPRRIIEIGSGWTSALMVDTITRHDLQPCDLTFIEPYADRLKSVLGAGELDARLVEAPLQEIDLGIFDELGPGDLLFIDSTHVSKAGSDVNRIFFEIFPRLASNVYIHLHDIFYPFEYPEQWIYGGRSWTELYILRAFLQNNRDYRVVLWGHQLHQTHPEVMAESLPLSLQNPGGSFWMQKMAER
jgi:predicted O-methyltransferase YrrM